MANSSEHKNGLTEIEGRISAEIALASAHVVNRTDAIMMAAGMMNDAIAELPRTATAAEIRRRAAALEAGLTRIIMQALDIAGEAGALRMAAMIRETASTEAGAL